MCRNYKYNVSRFCIWHKHLAHEAHWVFVSCWKIWGLILEDRAYSLAFYNIMSHFRVQLLEFFEHTMEREKWWQVAFWETGQRYVINQVANACTESSFKLFWVESVMTTNLPSDIPAGSILWSWCERFDKEVLASLSCRKQFCQADGWLLWLHMLQESEGQFYPRHIQFYSDIYLDSRSEIESPISILFFGQKGPR